jgi:hypothetical protein
LQQQYEVILQMQKELFPCVWVEPTDKGFIGIL